MVKFLLWTVYFYDFESYLFDRELFYEQGQIHGTSVADGWAGAIMQKLLAIQKCYQRTDGPMQWTDRHGKV